MWRLSLAGHADLPWEVPADVPSPSGFSFSNFHRAFVLVGTNDLDGLTRFSQELRDRAISGPNLGGSRAQLEVLDDTLIEALRRSGRSAEARERLAQRLQRRPSNRDRDWLSRIQSTDLQTP